MDNLEIRKQMELEQKRAFCKQSCTKIDQGLDRLDPRSGERAIWELFQNARDLAMVDSNGEKKAHIRITLTPTEFIFAHQGRPFDHDSLTSLVMQVSSQGKENDDTIGQYGTGFLTTHVFGRKLCVTGSLDMSKYTPGTYADINRFVIDRTYDNISEFMEKVAHQLVAVNDYADEPKTAECRQWTILSYDLSSMEGAIDNATLAIVSSLKVIPYVMTTNKPIVDVTIENQLTGDIYRFEKKQLPDEAGLKVMQVTASINGALEEQKIYYLESQDGEDVAILPLESPTKAKSLKGIAKLFVFFPLLGTEEFGMDAIFHSKKFIPVEERNGLHLPVMNVNVRAKYEQNVRVLNSLSQMVQNYYRSHAESITNWVDVAGLSFDCEHHKEDITKNFFIDFKKSWSAFYQTLPIVDLNGTRVSVNGSDARFFSPVIVADIESDTVSGVKNFTALYEAAVLNNRMVDKDETLSWSKVVSSWDASHPSLLSAEDIAKSIGETENVSVNVLYAFDAYISAKKYDSFFDSYNIIPNREGKKMKKSSLRNAKTIPVWLGEMSKTLVSDKVEMFAEDSFTDLVSLTVFSRNDLREAINSKLTTLRRDNLDKGNQYNDSIVGTLLEMSSIFSSEMSAMVRRKTIAIIGHNLGKEINTRLLPPLDSNERDIAELPFKHLIENALLGISQSDSAWVLANMEYVLSLHTELSTWSEYYNRNTKDGLCVKYGAFPNRNGQPCVARELEKGIDIPESLTNLYMEVMGDDLNTRLVDQKFETFFDFPELTAKAVAGEVESMLEEDGFTHSAVLDIINNLEKDACWIQWFPHIEAKKAELFLNHVQNDCKESIFKLMKINDSDKLNQLAELADEVDLDEIIRKGREAVVERQNKEADFNLKLALGEYVEEIIRKNLEGSLSGSDITVVPEDLGSDISVRKDGKPIYYIEVKSRWNSNQSVMMSPLQMQTSVKESGNYSLCCVDMTRFSISDAEEHKYPELEEVLPYIRVLPEIGSLTEELSHVAEGKEDRPVRIGGDYKCIVPQNTIESFGKEFASLIEAILAKV